MNTMVNEMQIICDVGFTLFKYGYFQPQLLERCCHMQHHQNEDEEIEHYETVVSVQKIGCIKMV